MHLMYIILWSIEMINTNGSINIKGAEIDYAKLEKLFPPISKEQMMESLRILSDEKNIKKVSGESNNE